MNLSPLGVAVAMSDGLGVGSEWSLGIELPTGTAQVHSRVVHCAKSGSTGQWVVGFCFLDLSQQIARELQAFMKSSEAAPTPLKK